LGVRYDCDSLHLSTYLIQNIDKTILLIFKEIQFDYEKLVIKNTIMQLITPAMILILFKVNDFLKFYIICIYYNMFEIIILILYLSKKATNATNVPNNL